MNDYIFTSESVSGGHPDKIADQISDAILDAYLAQDPHARVALETLVTTNTVILAGEVKTNATIQASDREQIVRQLIKKVGYDQEGFHWQTVQVTDLVHRQSPDINQGVDQASGIIGAGDQGMMVGYACDETPAYLPAPLYYAHKILQAIQNDREKGFLPDLGPDAKSQVTCIYEDHMPVGVAKLVISHQHKDSINTEQVRKLLMPYIEAILPKGWAPNDKDIMINPTGRFVIGGPVGDTGLTGRKIIVDTYGGAAPHGGGAFSGKDPSKVDRSAAYLARYIAKNIVASGLAKRATIQLAYVIGSPDPVSFYIDLHDTGKVEAMSLIHFFNKHVDMTPAGIMKRFNLNRPIFSATSTYGHFGKDPQPNGSFSWEQTDLVQALQEQFNTHHYGTAG